MRRSYFIPILLIVLAGLALEAGAAEQKRILGIFYRGCEEICKSFKAEINKSGLGADFVVLATSIRINRCSRSS